MKKVCLVGCGTIARLHAKNLVGKVELSFHSRTQASAEELSRQCGGGQVFASYADVLDSAVDAVLISSPPDVHRSQVVAALAADKGVLVEKPLCATADDLTAIGAAAAAHPDALLMIAENYYYKPSLKLLQWIIRQGFIGQVQQAIIGKRFTQQATGWKSGYGALLEGGIHFVALGADLFADAPQRVTAEFPGHQAGEPERNSVVRIEYPSGAELVLHYAWNAFSLTKGTFQHARILGTEGADRLRVQWAIRALAGAAEAALLSGRGGLDGLQGHDAGLFAVFAGAGAATVFKLGAGGTGFGHCIYSI